MNFSFELLHPVLNGGNWYPVLEPIGWDGVELKLSRHETFHGFTHTYSLPVKWHGKAYRFIRQVYEQFGADETIQIRISLLCTSPTSPASLLFQGKLNLYNASFSFDNNRCLVECEVEQDSNVTRFFQRLDQKVNLLEGLTVERLPIPAPPAAPYNGKYAYPITMHSKGIYKRLITQPAFVDPDDVYPGGYEFEYIDLTPLGTDPYAYDHRVVMTLGGSASPALNDFGDAYNISTAFVMNDGDVSTPSEDLLEADNYIFEAPQTGAYQVKICNWHVHLTVASFNVATAIACADGEMEQSELKVWLRSDLGLAVLLGEQNNATCHNLNDYEATLNYSASLNLTVAERLYLSFEYRFRTVVSLDLSAQYNLFHYLRGNSFQTFEDVDSCLSIERLTTSEETQARVVLFYEAFERLAKAITDNALTVQSAFYGRTDSYPNTEPVDGCGSKMVLTNGLLLRGYEFANERNLTLCCDEPVETEPEQEPIPINLQVSFEELFSIADAIHNIGLGLEPLDGTTAIRIEEKRHFYDPVSPPVLTITRPAKYASRPLEAEHFNSVEGGYDTWESEAVNGIDEFNTPRIYTGVLRHSKETLTRTRCNAIASGYAIEITRREGKTTTDFKYDNNLFVVCVEESDVTKTERGDSLDADGFPVFQPLPTSHARFRLNGNVIDWQTAYNLRIAPQRNLQRWFPILFAGSNTYRQSGYKGNDLEAFRCLADCCGDETPEDYPATYKLRNPLGDVVQPACKVPYYRLELLEMEYPLSFEQYMNCRAFPYRRVQCYLNNSTQATYWYIREIAWKPAKGMAKFKLVPVFEYDAPAVYANVEYTAECPPPATGTPVTIPAGVYTSVVSQAEADEQARVAAQSLLECDPPAVWWNQEVLQECIPPLVGNPVIIPPNTYSSSISQADADAQAVAAALAALDCAPPVPADCDNMVYNDLGIDITIWNAELATNIVIPAGNSYTYTGCRTNCDGHVWGNIPVSGIPVPYRVESLLYVNGVYQSPVTTLTYPTIQNISYAHEMPANAAWGFFFQACNPSGNNTRRLIRIRPI